MPRGHKASASSMDAGFDRWISTKVSYGGKRPREDHNNGAATSPSSSTNNNGKGGGHNDVTVSLSIDEQHWLESLYTRACQNCLSHLGNEQSAQEEACIEARCALDVDQQVHEQAFMTKLQRECATKRKSMMTVRGPNSDANTAIVIPKSLDFLSQFSTSSAAGGDGVGNAVDMFGDCPFGDEDEFADATGENNNGADGEAKDNANNGNNDGDEDDDDKDVEEDNSKEVQIAKRAVEIDAAVEAFREQRLAAFREDEIKIRAEKEDGLVKEYPLGTLDGDEQSVLLLELGTIWRQKLAEIVNPDSALRRRIAGDAGYATGLVLGAQEGSSSNGSGVRVVDDSARLTQNCLHHLTTQPSNNQSLFITANPDSAFLNLISEVAQKRIQAKMLAQSGVGGTDSAKMEVALSASAATAQRNTTAPTTTATTPQASLAEDSDDEDIPISQLLARKNNKTNKTTAVTKVVSDTSSLGVFRQDTGLLDAMAQVARLQAQITAKEEEEGRGGDGHQTPFQKVGWAQMMGQRNDAGRHFLSRCSGTAASLPTTPTTPLSPLPPQSSTSVLIPKDQAASQQQQQGVSPSAPPQPTGYNHLMRVSRKQLRIEEVAIQAASKQGVRAHLPCDFPDEFTIPLGEMDEEEVRLVEGGFRWPFPNLLVDQRPVTGTPEVAVPVVVTQNSNSNSSAANKKLEKKMKKMAQLARAAEEESFGLKDFTRIDLQNAILRGIPTLTGGTIKRRGDDIIVSGGSVLTIPTTSAATAQKGGYNGGCDSGGEVALSSYVVSISLPGAL